MRRPDDTNAPWAPYTPDASAPWDARRVVHLHRRAGFGATWGEVRRDLRDGPEASVARVLAGKPRAYAVPASFEPTSTLLGDAAVASRDPNRLKAWWLYRMAFGPDPLLERLTMMWHDHFATSNAKVEDLAAMRRQNETFRRLARAPFGELLAASIREPALLAWLDAPANRKGHPNENLARELMELFTLGVGNYSEADVRDSARALTGWSVEEGQFRAFPGRHDDDPKSILGRTGKWSGDDLVKILLDRPSTGQRLAWRLCSTFFGEGAVGPEAIKSLGVEIQSSGLDVGRAVATILRSRAFFDRANLGTKVVAPVEFVVSSTRTLELLDPPPSTLVMADWASRLGQDLFYPPNVGGWPGGRAWLTTRSVIGRANYAAALVEGRGVGRPGAMDASGLATRHDRGASRESMLGFFSEVLLGSKPTPAWSEKVEAAVGPSASWTPELARRAVGAILASPESQLG